MFINNLFYNFIQETLLYKEKKDQHLLLQKVLAANETDAEEEKLPGDTFTTSSKSQVSTGNVKHFIIFDITIIRLYTGD